MVEFIVPIALVLLALAAMRFGHDSREPYASNEAIRSDIGYREDAETVVETPSPVRPAQAPRLADAHR
jgi:hypothetical protein